MNFKQWLKDNSQSIDMTGDAWQIHEQVDTYTKEQTARIAELEAALEESNKHLNHYSGRKPSPHSLLTKEQ